MWIMYKQKEPFQERKMADTVTRGRLGPGIVPENILFKSSWMPWKETFQLRDIDSQFLITENIVVLYNVAPVSEMNPK